MNCQRGVLLLALALSSLFGPRVEGQRIAGAETVIVHSGGLELRGLLWRPAGGGPFPAVLFNHGSGPTREMHQPSVLGPAFVRHGYAFLFLYRRGSGLSAAQGKNSVEQMRKALAERGQAARNQLQLQLLDTELNDVRAGLAFLRARPEVDRSRVAAAGHSFGGSLTLMLLERDAGLRGAVIFGGAAGSWDASPPLQSRLRAAVDRATAPVFFIYAANDYSTAPGTTLSAEMEKVGKPHRLEIYPAVGHSAAEGHDLVYRALSTWERDVFAFLDEHMHR